MSRKSYEDRLLLPLHGVEDVLFSTKSGTPVAKGYARVVIGDRGPYIEFEIRHLLNQNFHIPPEQAYRKTDKRVYYVEARSNDEANVKLYLQKRTVAYADYRVGMGYISPFDLVSDKYPLLVQPLEESNGK